MARKRTPDKPKDPCGDGGSKQHSQEIAADRAARFGITPLDLDCDISETTLCRHDIQALERILRGEDQRFDRLLRGVHDA